MAHGKPTRQVQLLRVANESKPRRFITVDEQVIRYTRMKRKERMKANEEKRAKEALQRPDPLKMKRMFSD